MHLRHRGAGDRHRVDAPEDSRQRAAVRAIERLGDSRPLERRHAVLELGELERDILGNEVGPHRQQLPELHEDRPQRLERQAQALAAGAGAAGP